MDEQLFGPMIDAVGVGVGAYDSTGVFVYANSAYAEMLGTDRESLLDTPVWEINEAIDPDRFDAYWNSYDVGETRTAEAVHGYGSQQVQVQTITTRVNVDGGEYNVGTIRDISLRKTRERQLGQLHAVIDELIEADSREEIAEITARTAETILDYETTVVRLRNDSAELEAVAVSERAKQELGDRPPYPVDGDTPAARAFREGEPLLIEDAQEVDDWYDRGSAQTVMYVPIGQYGLVSITDPKAEAFDTADIDLASILVSNAETALRRLEYERDLERQNERLAAFVDVISHDIPNHLNVAETRLDLTRRTNELAHLSHVETAHERIESVIVDMRQLVDQGEQIEEMSWVRFQDIVGGCWVTCREENADATLSVVDEGYVRADESRLKQLFENLFWNALEHAGDAPRIRAGLLERGFYVEDDGPGIPESERDAVLSPGYSTSEGEAHAGFGLAIVREIAHAHDWDVEITESKEGGARFEITGVGVRRDSHRMETE